MILDSTVTVIKKDGTRVITNEVHPGDDIVGASYEDIASRIETPEEHDKGWQRTDAGEVSQGISVAPVVAEVIHPDKPAASASKRDWWEYARELGYGAEDYEHTSKAELVALYGDVDPQKVIGA